MGDSNRPEDASNGDEKQSRWNQAMDWILFDADRLVLAGCLLIIIFPLLGLLELVDIIAVQDVSLLPFVFSGLIGGNLTLITVVLSINQLVLSRELGSPAELRNRVHEVADYRQQVEEEMSNTVAPVTPSDFLQLLLQITRQQAQALGGITTELDNQEARDAIDDIVMTITGHVDQANRLFRHQHTDLFTALSATLRTNYAHQIYEIRQIRMTYGNELSDEATETLEELVHRLQQIDVARQYFKGLYLQTELAQLSRVLLYVGIPTEIILVTTILTFAGSTGPTLPLAARLVYIPLTITIGFAPLAVLSAFILRISMVAQLTVAITPFTKSE